MADNPSHQKQTCRAKNSEHHYRVGVFTPNTDPLTGLTAIEIHHLQALGAARDNLDTAKVERLLADEGTCRQIGRHLWYPTGRSYLNAIKPICRRCPVKRPCLLYALATNQQHGMWAGQTTQHRNRLATRIRAALARAASRVEGGDHAESK